MHTAAALLDMHRRTHLGLAALVDHCRGFAPADFSREHAGFGYSSLRLQLHHVIGAEAYWTGVLEGRVEADFDDAAYPTPDSLDAWRARVAAATDSCLGAYGDADLNAPRELETWGGRRQELVPAQVILRVLTHAFHHQGQMAAMCRLLDRPVAGLDWPHS